MLHLGALSDKGHTLQGDSSFSDPLGLIIAKVRRLREPMATRAAPKNGGDDGQCLTRLETKSKAPLRAPSAFAAAAAGLGHCSYQYGGTVVYVKTNLP